MKQRTKEQEKERERKEYEKEQQAKKQEQSALASGRSGDTKPTAKAQLPAGGQGVNFGKNGGDSLAQKPEEKKSPLTLQQSLSESRGVVDKKWMEFIKNTAKNQEYQDQQPAYTMLGAHKDANSANQKGYTFEQYRNSMQRLADEKKAHPYNFQNQRLQEIMDDTVAKIRSWHSDTTGRDLEKDAHDITQKYYEDMAAAYNLNLFDDPRSKDPVGISQKRMADNLEYLRGQYAANGKSPMEIKSLLDQSNYMDALQVMRGNKQNIQDFVAQNVQGDWTPEQKDLEKQAAGFETVDAKSVVERMLNGEGYNLNLNEAAAWQEFMRDPENQQLFASGDAAQITQRLQQQNTQKAADLRRQKGKPTYEQADAYLTQHSDVYDLTKLNPGHDAEYAALYNQLPAIFEKVWANGAGSLTDMERDVYQTALNTANNPEMNYALLNGDREKALPLLAAFGKAKAQEVQGMSNNMFAQYDPTPYQRALREAYLNTPEGAKEYLDEAVGTEYEQEANDNYYNVTNREKFNSITENPDFEALAKPDKEFHSGDTWLDNAYEFINDFGYARANWEMSTARGGVTGREMYVYDEMTPEEKAKFNAWAKSLHTKEAKEYLDYLMPALNERYAQKEAERVKEFTESGVLPAVAANVLSVPMNQFAGLMGSLDYGAQWLANKFRPYGERRPIDTNTQWQAPAQEVGQIRESTNEQINQALEGNETLQYWAWQFYNGGMSLADTTYGGLLMKGLGLSNKMASGVGAAMTASRSAQEAFTNAVERTGNQDTAMAMATIAFLGEAVPEKITLGKFLDDLDSLGGKGFVKKMMSFVTEGAENALQEGLTEGIDVWADRRLLKNKGKYGEMAQYLHDMGVSDTRIEQLIMQDVTTRVLDASVGGLLMGGMGAAAANIGGDINRQSELKGLGKAVGKDARAGLQELAANLGGDAAKLAGKYNPAKAGNRQTGKLMEAVGKEAQGRAIQGQGAVGNRTRQIVKQLSAQTGRAETAAWGRGFDAENATDQETGALLRQIFKDLPDTAGQLKGTVHQAVAYDIADQITALGGNESGESAIMAADALASLFAGEELTHDQIQALAGSEGGMALMRQMMGGETANQQQAMDEVADVPGLEDAPIDADQAEGQPGVATTTLEGQPIPGGTRADRAQAAPMDDEKGKGPAPADQRREGEALTNQEGQPIPGGTREDRAQPAPMDEEKGKGPAPADQRQEEGAPIEPNAAPIPGGTREDRAQAVPMEDEKGKGPQKPETRVKIKNPDGGESTEKDVTFKKSDDGLVAVDADGGETAADDLELSPAQQKVVNLAEGMEDEEAANDMISALQGETDPETAGQNALAFIGVQKQAARGVSLDQSGSLFGNLTPAQKQAAWQAGRRQYEAAQADTRMRTQQAAKRDGVRTIDQAQPGETGLYYAGVTKVTTPAQKVQLRLLNQFARQNGLQILVYDTMGSANGAYRTGSNVISIALDAEGGGLTRAASHEGYHYIMDHDKEAGQKIRGFVVEQLKKTDGYNLDERIAQVKQQYRDAAGQELTDDMALEEIIADSMLDMIGNQENLKPLVQKGSGVLEQIRAWLEKTLQALRRIIDNFAKNSPEAAALKDQTEWFEQLRTMYDEAMQNIKKNGTQAQQALFDDIKDNESVAAYQQDLGAAMNQDEREGALNGLLTDLFNRIERPWIEAHPDEYEQGSNNFVDALRDFAEGKTKSLSFALGTRGLNVPGSAENNMLLTYAARQITEGAQRAQADGQAGGESPETRLSLRKDTSNDAAYMAAVERGDEDEARRLVYQVAARAGYTPVIRYHQTGAEFTVFSTANPEAGANDDETPNGIFFKENDHDIGVGADFVKTGHGGQIQMPVYLKADNMLHFANRKEARAWYKKNVPGYKELNDQWDRTYAEKYKPQFDAINDEMFDPETSTERYDELDKQEEELIKVLGEEENKHRRKTRAALDDYFIKGNSGYDGIELDYDGHRYIDGKRENVHTYIVFDPSQVKSADIITYDNNGQIIPLSERFQADNNDIRYSLRTDAQQQETDIAESVRADADLFAQAKMDEDARAALEMVHKLHDLTTRGGENALIQRGAFEKRLSGIADKILEDTGSKYGKRKLMEGLRKLYSAMEERRYSVGDMAVYARDLMQNVLEAAPGVLVEQDETTKEVIRILKNNPFFLTEGQKNEIKYTYGAVGDYVRKNFGKMKIRKDNGKISSLAEVWRESLTPLMPGTFAEDANEADMPAIIDAFLENAGQKKFAGNYGANIGAYATDMALNTMLDFYDVPGALKTKADIRAEFVQQYQRDRERVEAIRESARSQVEAARIHYQERYQERIGRAQERKDETERKRKLRKEISSTVRQMNTMSVRPTDSRHVPEAMRGAVLAAVRPFLDETGVFSRAEMDRLGFEYSQLQERQGEIGGFDEDILESIKGLPDQLNGRRLSQLSESELLELRDIVGNLKKIVTNSNEAFLNGIQTTVDALSGQLKADMHDRKAARQGKAAGIIRGLSLKETTPTYFADRVGGVVGDMVRSLFRGQNDWAFTVSKAKDFAGEQIKKYNVRSWIYDKNHLRFTSQHGDTLELNRQEAMSLYCLWKRETGNKLQNANHLRIGGFMYEKGTKYEGVDTLRPHPITEVDMAQVNEYLTDEQKAFADAMVDYLSKDMSKLGNEVSMALYGYEKFKEGYYFPYESDRRYLVGDLTQTGEVQKQPKNAGFSKATLKNAATPITVHGFMDVWGGHVNQMALYHAFAQDMDTMNRVFNDRISGEAHLNSATGEIDVSIPESNWIEMERALGAEGVAYIKTLARDVAGGVRADERGNLIAKGISAFKKASVAGNLSVVVQQPTAIARAMLMVSPRYLLTSNPAKLAKNIKNMYHYSGVAIIKDMGKFDTGTGKGAVQWLTEDIGEDNLGRKILSGIDTAAGIGAEKADEWTWGLLWGAIEKETEHRRADLAPGTEEFYQAVAERFEDVVNHTQVYDSVLSRSEWMRSNTNADKMATAFMAEPTLTFNMLQDAVVNYRQEGRGAKGVTRAAAAFTINCMLTALAKSIITATRRKNDEGRTWLEKYLAEATANFAEDLSPFGIASLVPWARDAVSIFEGYDVGRSDMDAVQQLYNAYKTLNNDNKTPLEKILTTSGAVANLFGIPAKNVIRDAEAIIRNVFGGESRPLSETSGRDIKYSVLESLNFAPFSFWDSGKKAYYDRMEKALIAGDIDQYNELHGYVVETLQTKADSVDSGIKQQLADSVIYGLISDDQALKIMQDGLGMTDKKAFEYLDKKVQMAAHSDDEDYDYSKYGAIIEAVKAGKDVQEEAARLTEHGTKEKDIENAIKDGIKELYLSGEITQAQVEEKLKQYLDITEKDDIYWLIDKWEYNNTAKKGDMTYSEYVDVYNAVKAGKPIDAAMKEMTDHGYEEKDVLGQVESKIGEWYRKGEMDKATAEKKIKQYITTLDENGLYWLFDKWDYAKAHAGDKKAENYTKYLAFGKAMDTGENLIAEVKRLRDHGVKDDTISSEITKHFKPLYLEAYYAGDKTKMAEIQARALTAYEQIGKKRSNKQKDIADWIKQEEKKNKENKK